MVYLGRTKRIHFVGIGGIGMSGIAEVLLNLGFEVSGSDLKKSDLTDRLEHLGAQIAGGHAERNIRGADVVVYSSAVEATNIELIEARKNEIPIIPRAEMLAELMRLKFAVTVAGSHGKTSTTSIVASVLAQGGLDPTVVVGGKLRALRSNARLGSSRYIVAEADESDGGFIQLPSTIAVITTIDLEHLDFYENLDAIKDGFIQYANKVPFYGSVILCADDPNICDAMARIKRRKVTYSLGGEADLTARVSRRDSAGSAFEVYLHGEPTMEVEHGIPGDHHVRNALAAIAVGLEMDIQVDAIKRGVESFEGVGRRFEVKGTMGGVVVVDDYGHHPTEIAATIRAAVESFGKRLFVLFQPHRYTRTQAVAEAFGNCFEGAYCVFITEIYPAGEKPIEGISAQTVIEQVRKKGNVDVRYVPSLEAMIEEAAQAVEPGDMVLTMGAGDIYKVGDALLERLKEKERLDAGSSVDESRGD
ncbi:MAG: UDP-N-acetylmuramate--L-alanine ligase [Candidatus Latescibacteria bacterium]|nr:UDP-N-acetylmuramate--L-alanine ligase [Candidatus Latescibacterota bacterium]NIM21071.1 UDP-N-acetylmuramate--L-alanine ligase [Candidatus Latescibacterota bacterium]NIM65206.1 UDP-N-acetylmuramate--L-alanine ligase [Candidatus Latescibacterota bacterium]NIO01721.1 UDP-N-acetylmuramate--L-alanine ligase [Candidatus Latescibacterota bacterium]NIO28238.1 UDP-N-acetylmuramate--L-alanine ligase [Candidatus Latescibacterota bacterium]